MEKWLGLAICYSKQSNHAPWRIPNTFSLCNNRWSKTLATQVQDSEANQGINLFAKCCGVLAIFGTIASRESVVARNGNLMSKGL